jgi:O-antigen ligase
MMSAGDASIVVVPQQRPSLRAILAPFWALSGSVTYRQIVTVWLGVFCAGFALLPGEWEQRWLFYIGIPLALPAVADAARRLAGGALFWTLTSFLAYSGLSALWSDQWLTVGDELRRAFWIEYFLLICCAIGASDLGWLRRVLQAVLLFAAVVAIYAVANFFGHCSDCGRFVGFGAHANSNYTASIAGALGLIGVAAAFSSGAVPSAAMLASQAPLCALLIATGSRAALLAYLGASLLSAGLVVRRSGRHHAVRAVVAVLVCTVVAVAAVAALGPNWLHTEIARGDSLRLQIWAENLQRIAQRPWFGYGATARDTVPLGTGEIGIHAHNSLLAQAFYGGVVGCGLWLAVLVLALRCGVRVFRARGELLPLGPLVFLVAVGLVDIGPVVVDVHPAWLYVWVVLGIALAYDTGLRRRATTSR